MVVLEGEEEVKKVVGGKWCWSGSSKDETVWQYEQYSKKKACEVADMYQQV
jgi:hypothetical protein